MAEEPRQRKRKMREGPAGGAKRGRQGADGRPMRKENQYQYARHAYNVMGCFVDIATSDLTDRDRKTPCLVHLPAILGLAIREDEWPLMQQSKSGAFVMPRGPMILIDDLPSFREPSRNASLDHLLKCIKQSPRYKLLMEAILDVDNGVIYDATTGSFMEVEGYEFFPGEAVQNLVSKFYGYRQSKALDEKLKDMVTLLPKQLRSALVSRHTDDKGREFWSLLLEQLALIVQEYVSKDQLDLQEMKRLHQKMQVSESCFKEAECDKERVVYKREYEDAKRAYDEVVKNKRAYVSLNNRLYVDEDFHVSLSAPNNTHKIYYQYITHDMDEVALREWFSDAVPDPKSGHAPDHEKKEVLDYLTGLLRTKDSKTPMKWPWCKMNHHPDKYCPIPQSFRQVDAAVVYASERGKKTGWKVFKTAPFLGEIHGPKTYDPMGAIFQESAHSLIFAPRCYGMVVYKEDVQLLEFRRDPKRSRIEVFQYQMLMNGNGNTSGSIGLDVQFIIEYILQCIVYGVFADLPGTVNYFKDLLDEGYDPDVPKEGPKRRPCKCCWHFKDYEDLKARYFYGKQWRSTEPEDEEILEHYAEFANIDES